MLVFNFNNLLKLSTFRWHGHSMQKNLHAYKRIIRHYKKEATENPTYDVIVVGGGHAGTEAASAAARMGCKTLLLTSNVDTIGNLVGSPSLGGAGSGHLIREIDALDGICGKMCDLSGIHYMVVNKHRNPGLWGPKVYVDRELYKKNIQHALLTCENLETKVATVENLIVSKAELSETSDELHNCSGVVLADGSCISSKTVILAIGKSLHFGTPTGLQAALQNLGFKHGRLQLGVAPRLELKSIDLSKLTAVNGDKVPSPFSFLNDSVWIMAKKQIPTYITRTNPLMEEVIQDSIVKRRCSNNESHSFQNPEVNPISAKRGRQQIWLEPEGLDHRIVYLGGFACPLPEDEQASMIHQLSGLEKAVIINPAFDQLYSFVDPRQVTATLETKKVSNLFLSGHLLGTGGYVEAAAQGVIAGINAGCKVLHRDPFIITSSDGYVGILISDISTHGIDCEPYSVPLCSPELSAVLRPDNADIRLSERAATRGCISQHRLECVANMRQRLKKAEDILSSDVRPLSEWLLLIEHKASKDEVPKSALEIFSMPNTQLESLVDANPEKFQFLLKDANFTARLKIEALFKASALEHQRAVAELKKSVGLPIPGDINFKSTELKFSPSLQQLFADVKPCTLEDASCIDGVTEEHLLRLLKFIKRHETVKKLKLKKLRLKL